MREEDRVRIEQGDPQSLAEAFLAVGFGLAVCALLVVIVIGMVSQ